MIVRLMGEGQWRVDDSVSTRLNQLDEEVAKAVEAGDEAALWRGLQELAETRLGQLAHPATLASCSRERV